MFRVNKKIEYGILALIHLAAQKDRAASVREISQLSLIPEALLGKIMQNLKNAGLVNAIQGIHGGYTLGKSLDEINLLELTEVLVGPIAVAECLQSEKMDECPIQSRCSISSPMASLNQQIIQLFQGTSLGQLTRRKEIR